MKFNQLAKQVLNEAETDKTMSMDDWIRGAAKPYYEALFQISKTKEGRYKMRDLIRCLDKISRYEQIEDVDGLLDKLDKFTEQKFQEIDKQRRASSKEEPAGERPMSKYTDDQVYGSSTTNKGSLGS